MNPIADQLEIKMFEITAINKDKEKDKNNKKGDKNSKNEHKNGQKVLLPNINMSHDESIDVSTERTEQSSDIQNSDHENNRHETDRIKTEKAKIDQIITEIIQTENVKDENHKTEELDRQTVNSNVGEEEEKIIIVKEVS